MELNVEITNVQFIEKLAERIVKKLTLQSVDEKEDSYTEHEQPNTAEPLNIFERLYPKV
jgi:hypothetical protein